MKKYIKAVDILTVLYWLDAAFIFAGKKFCHKQILEQAHNHKLNGKLWNTSIYRIDEMVIDALIVYKEVIRGNDQIAEIMCQEHDDKFNEEEIPYLRKRFLDICETLIVNYRYENPQAIGIQMDFLTGKLDEYVKEEAYEKAAIMKKRIEECKLPITGKK